MDRTRLVGTTTPAAASRRSGVALVADELRRLMPRDLWLLGLLDEHQALTTEQITAIAFPTPAKAHRRLRLLHERGVLDRFRRAVRPGSQSWRWTLGPLGAAVVAAGNADPIPRPAVVRARTDRLAGSPRLNHLLGVNQVFCALLAHARHHPHTRLVRWWPERRATRAAGNLVRPDGHGVWQADGVRMPFWLEFDTGSEQLADVVDKLTGYTRLAQTPVGYPVLFWLPNATREQHLHALISRYPAAGRVTIATAATDHATTATPAGRVWRIVGQHHHRLRLSDIPTVATSDTDP